MIGFLAVVLGWIIRVSLIKYEFNFNILVDHMLCGRHYSIFYKEFFNNQVYNHCPSLKESWEMKNYTTAKTAKGNMRKTQHFMNIQEKEYQLQKNYSVLSMFFHIISCNLCKSPIKQCNYNFIDQVAGFKDYAVQSWTHKGSELMVSQL